MKKLVLFLGVLMGLFSINAQFNRDHDLITTADASWISIPAGSYRSSCLGSYSKDTYLLNVRCDKGDGHYGKFQQLTVPKTYTDIKNINGKLTLIP